MPKRLLFIISVILMACLVLGGCAMGTGEDNQDNAAVSVPVGQGNDRDETGKLTVSFIDVGQGDAILIQTPAGQSMLIDGGERGQGEKVVEYLRKQGISKVDIMVGTHPHSDHIGGLIEVLEKFKVDKVYLPKVTHTTSTFRDLLTGVQKQGIKVSTAKAGVTIPLEGLDANFAAPTGDTYESLNNYSAVVKLVYGNNSFVFTGDAEEESEQEMLHSSLVGGLKAEVLKVGHHGSSSSTSERFLNVVAPQYAVIMCGTDNDYGHPHKETIEKLNQAGVKIYRTDQNGNIVITSDGNTFETITFGDVPAAEEAPDVAPDAGLNDRDIDEDTYYIGNTNSNKFHRVECKYLPAEHNQVKFKTREEAVEAGYSPCSICQP